MVVPPHYRPKEVAGHLLWWEDKSSPIDEITDIRLYYPDHNGRLRLVFINDSAGKQHYILDRQTLLDYFGITYKDLGIRNESRLRDYVEVGNLDPLCTWPARLYPEGPPKIAADAEKAPLEKLSSDISGQATISRTDAWI